MKKTIFAALSGIFFLTGCAGRERIKPEAGSVILDVRSREEFDSGHIDGAVCIPHTEIEEKISSVVPDKKTPVYIYCRSGRRSKAAADKMRLAGYENLHDLGGFSAAAKALGK